MNIIVDRESQQLVRFLVLYPIKSHNPLLEKIPVKLFGFHCCQRTLLVNYFTRQLYLMNNKINNYRLQDKLLGSLILFAPYPFVTQRQLVTSNAPSPLMFLELFVDFILTIQIPITSIKLQFNVENITFYGLIKIIKLKQSIFLFMIIKKPPTNPLHPIMTNNSCITCLSEASGTGFGRCFQILCLFQYKSSGLYNLIAFITHAIQLDRSFLHCPIFPTAANIMFVRCCLRSYVVNSIHKLTKDRWLGMQLPFPTT